MIRSRRFLRPLKWLCSLVAVITAAAWIYSTQRWVQLNTTSSVSCLQSGMFGIQWGDQYQPASWRGSVPALNAYDPSPSPGEQEFDYHLSRTGGYLFLPLSIPLALSLPVAALGWWFDRRPRSRPGTCKNCAYDLTANTSGRCPECGEPVPRA